MMKDYKYELIDYKNLVTLWYNEFLPKIMYDKSFIVPNSDILYFESISLEPLMDKSMEFMLGAIERIKKDQNSTSIIVQESKPINNVKMRHLIGEIVKNPKIDDKHIEKIIQVSNRRYIPMSKSVLISQEREMGEFLSKLFIIMNKKVKFDSIKFYDSSSLDFKSICDVASGFFPKRMLDISSEIDGSHITVSSSNVVLLPMIVKILGEGIGNKTTSQKVIDNTIVNTINEFEKII